MITGICCKCNIPYLLKKLPGKSIKHTYCSVDCWKNDSKPNTCGD